MSSRIEDYAILGDRQTAALVGRDGSVDWLCWPRFDSPACFARILGTPEHGRWLLAPADPEARCSRSYRGDTLVLETSFECADGAVTVIDFMPPRGRSSDLVRMVAGRRGRVDMRTELVLRFDYGSAVPWVTRRDDGALRAIAGPDMVVLRSSVALHGEGLTSVAEFSVGEGEVASFVLTHAPSHEPLPEAVDPRSALDDTLRFWTEWTARCRHAGPWRDAVVRSLVTLEALTYAPTGGIVAAPTTSLPERLGGVRNWDYRYCWLRDATLTLLAFMDAGYTEEAVAWRDWLLRAVAGSPDQLQIMYGVGGERRLLEWELDLPGHEGSRPVRVGNAAYRQHQLDAIGHVVEALHQARVGGMACDDLSWRLQRALVEQLESEWQRPDLGIWEFRAEPRHFTHSKVMAWVAVDRAIKSAVAAGLDAPLDRWRTLRAAIHADACARGYDSARGTFVQSYGSRELDASLLVLPLVGFLPPEDPRIRGTVAAIERELCVDGLVLRYRTEGSPDGLPEGEGAFLACSFWLADNLVLQGRRQDAVALFERLLALRNDVGLLAEEHDPRSGRMLGNFPQAFSHVGLVDTALNLEGGAAPARQRADAGLGPDHAAGAASAR